MPSIADRVRETTTTTGTGTVNLEGAVTGFQMFSSAFSTGTEVYYCLSDGTNWEIGYGAVTTGSPWTLARSTVLQSSNADALVNFGAGVKDIFCTMPAAALDILKTASGISNTPAGNIAATTVQAAINELDGEKETATNKDASGGYAGLTLFKLNLRNAANTFTNFLTNATTAARTWTMPDKDGTVAMTSDITGTNSGTNTGDQTSIVGITGTLAQFNTAVSDADLAILGANTFTADQTLNNNNLKTIKTATFNGQGAQTSTTGALTIDWTAAQNYLQTEPTGAITYTFTAPPGPCHLQLIINSDGTSTAQVITWPGTVKHVGTTWAGVNNKAGVINFWYDGASYWAMGSNQV